MQGQIVVLPKFTVSAATANLVAERAPGTFVLTQSTLAARKFRFLLYSTNNTNLIGNRGNLLGLQLTIPDIAYEPMDVVDGVYSIEIDNVIISGNDNGNIASESTHTGKIAVGGSSEFDPVIDPNQIAYLKENPTANTYFYNVKASDADTNNFLDDYKITSGNDDGTFGIISETGDLYVLKPENVDYEAKQSYSLGITVSDGFSTSAEEIVEIKITDSPNAFTMDNFTVNIYRDNDKYNDKDGDNDFS